jgi:hypothetical protein
MKLGVFDDAASMASIRNMKMTFKSEFVYFFVISMGKDWTTNIAVTTYRRTTFDFVSHRTVIPDLKRFLTQSGYKKYLKAGVDLNGVTISPNQFEQDASDHRHLIWRPSKEELNFPYVFDLWIYEDRVHVSNEKMITEGRAIGMQFLHNLATHALFIYNSNVVVYQFTKS